jgi:hypothetical protein
MMKAMNPLFASSWREWQKEEKVWNLVSDIKGGTSTEGVWEQGAEGSI